MGYFKLGKMPLGKKEVSTHSKLGRGKLSQCLFGVHINEPTGNIMALHDAFRGKEFQPNDAGLDGYPYRAEIVYNPSVGGSEGYQFLVKTYYAEDAEHGGDAENVNGTEVLDGEPTPIPKIYLNRLCRWDFGDVRFQLKGVASATAYTYKLIEKVDGVSALFLFKSNENPDGGLTVCCYWGKQTATDESSDEAAEAIIPGAVLSMPLDEGTVGWLSGYPNRKTHVIQAGQGVTAGMQTLIKVYYAAGTDGSETLNGENIGKVYVDGKSRTDFADLRFTSADGITLYQYKLISKTDGVSALFLVRITEALDVDRTMYTYYGNLTATSLSTDLAAEAIIPNVALAMPLDEANASDPAYDYSGNGNHGTATGTTIIDSPFYTGKKARQFNGISDYISITDADELDVTKDFTLMVIFKPTIFSASGYLRLFDKDRNAEYGLVLGNSGTSVTNVRLWGKIGGTAQTLTGSTAGSIALNELVKLITTYDGTTVTYIKNGASIGTNTPSPNGDFTTSTNNVYIGKQADAAANYFQGIFGGVYKFSRVLDSDEITAINSNYPDPRLIEGSLVVRKWASTTLPTHGAWGVEETTEASNTVKDYSGNGYHGTATGTTIVPHPLYAGKNARQFNGISDGIICPNVTLGTDITVIHIVKVLSTSDSSWTKSLRFGAADISSGQGNLSTSANWLMNLGFTDGDGNNVNSQFGVGQSPGQTLFFAIGYKNGDDKVTGGVNGVFEPISISVAGLTPRWNGTKTLYLGRSSVGEYGNVVILGTYIFNRLLSQAEVQAIYSGYPDPHLEQGKIHVRKWASTTLPTVASVSSMQTRKSYGKQELYPAIDNLNFVLDQANKKATLEFYLENTQLKTATFVEIATYGAGWLGHIETVVADDTTVMGNSMKVSFNRIGDPAGCYKSFDVAENWAAVDFITFYMYGSNSGRIVSFCAYDSDGSTIYEGTTLKGAQYNITDNFIGKKRIVIPRAAMSASTGATNGLPDWTQIKRVAFKTDSGAAPFIIYFNDLGKDVGVWAYVEAGVPDVLQLEGGNGTTIPAKTKLRLATWNGSAYTNFTSWDGVNFVCYSPSLRFLDGTQQSTITGSNYIGAVTYDKGKRGETANKIATIGSVIPALVYNKAKTRYRVGFAIKMPPADLNASATTGIGQVRLKLEVYYQ